MKLRAQDRRTLRPIIDEIEHLGGSIDEIKRGRHWTIMWTLRGRKLRFVAGVTPCPSSLQNVIAQLRRLARDAA